MSRTPRGPPDGFRGIVDRVAVIEKHPGIPDLAQFTPKEYPC